MHQSKQNKKRSAIVISTLAWGGLIACGMNAHAAENFKLRQSPLGSFGGDIATPADKPGFFGTASLTQVTIDGIKGPTGEAYTKPTGVTNLSLTGLAALKQDARINAALSNSPQLGLMEVTVADTKVSLKQDQTVVNLAFGYLTETKYSEGHIAFVANVPLLKQSRTLLLTPSPVSFSTTQPQYISARPTVAGLLDQANINDARDKSNLATGDATGLGDIELSTVWVRHTGPLKVAAGVSVYVPTGKYNAASDAASQANPGFGNFYTIRPGVAFTYNLNPNHSHQDWDAGVTIAGRVAYGMNTENKDTKYKSGNFIYSEAAIVKVSGNFALGMNVFSTQQVTDDTYSGTDLTKLVNGRYKTLGGGPFISYKIPGQDAGLNFQVNNNFQGRNAINVKSYQLRLIKAF